MSRQLCWSAVGINGLSFSRDAGSTVKRYVDASAKLAPSTPFSRRTSPLSKTALRIIAPDRSTPTSLTPRMPASARFARDKSTSRNSADAICSPWSCTPAIDILRNLALPSRIPLSFAFSSGNLTVSKIAKVQTASEKSVPLRLAFTNDAVSQLAPLRLAPAKSQLISCALSKIRLRRSSLASIAPVRSISVKSTGSCTSTNTAPPSFTTLN